MYVLLIPSLCSGSLERGFKTDLVKVKRELLYRIYTPNINEDPALGFQELFMEEMYVHAIEVKSFPSDVNQVMVRDWYEKEDNWDRNNYKLMYYILKVS